MTGATPKRDVSRQSQVFFFIILAGLLLLTWTVFKPFVIFMVTGVFVAVLALPVDKFWERLFPNRVAAIFTMVTLLVIFLMPLTAIGLALANDAQSLAESIQSGEAQERFDTYVASPTFQRVLELMYPDNTTDERNATLQEQVDTLQEQAIEQLTNFAKSVATALPSVFVAITVILFVVYYVLTDGEKLVGYLRRAAPLPVAQVDTLMREAHNGLKAVFVGQVLTSLIQGGLGGVGFLIAGVPGAVLWASVMAVLSLLPVVGAFLVWVPVAVFMLISGDLWQGFFLLGWGVLIVSQVDNLIRPRLIGNRAQIHPLFVLIGVLGGVAAFGFIGLFLGPVLVGVTLSVLKVWENEYLDPLVGPADPTRQSEEAKEA